MNCLVLQNAADLKVETNAAGIEVYTWQSIRKQNLKALRIQIRHIIFFLGWCELLKHDVLDLVWRGKHGTNTPGSEDYGLAYNVAFVFGWIYMCIFMIVYTPAFSWWLPYLYGSTTSHDTTSGENDTPSKPRRMDTLDTILHKINMILLPACVLLYLYKHIYYTFQTLVFAQDIPVDPKKRSLRTLNSYQAWLYRGPMLCGIVYVPSLGYFALRMLEDADLARVKTLEYWVILVPIMINLGLRCGTWQTSMTEKWGGAKPSSTDIESAVEEKQRLATIAATNELMSRLVDMRASLGIRGQPAVSTLDDATSKTELSKGQIRL